ncbi:hypothetical protein WBP07_21640 (plasmid) [Novosphingobium sp. BL-8A]|uniref:hypothetical protein n=1 Tax=Novosphingobium sp. BL-8A TaxID=3127639 RepID=UPI0037564670
MEAPVYPPARSYVAPRRLARVLSVRDTPIAVLQSIAPAWAIVGKEIPGFDRRVSSDMIKPHLGNFSLESLTIFGVVDQASLDRIDPQLKALGEFP